MPFSYLQCSWREQTKSNSNEVSITHESKTISRACHDNTSRMIKPALGRYKTLSATTKPTWNSKFEAGTNGKIIKIEPTTNGFDPSAYENET